MKNESREAENLAEAWRTVEDMANFTRAHPTCETSTTRALEVLAAEVRRLEALALGLARAARLLVDESERILFAKQENGGDYPGLALALSRMNSALLSKAAKSQEDAG